MSHDSRTTLEPKTPESNKSEARYFETILVVDFSNIAYFRRNFLLV
jgi:hypothetical protein